MEKILTFMIKINNEQTGFNQIIVEQTCFIPA
jgi:hypothetical protein